MRIQYQALDKGGQSTAAVIEASSQEEAAELLRQQGLFPTELKEGPKLAGSGKGRRISPGRGRGGQLANFARNLQILISSGTPLTESLVIVERQMEHPGWKQVLGEIREAVEGGEPLSAALKEHPNFFDGVCRSLIAAGEASGELPTMLDRLAILKRRQARLRSSLAGAMVYPMLLCLVGVSVMITLFVFVLPRFADLFKTLDVPLPPTTTFLIVTGQLAQRYWWLIVLVLGGAGAAFRWWVRTEAGRSKVHTALLHVPKLGPLLKNLATARLARLLGVLVDSFVPLLDALALVKQAAGSGPYQELISRAEDAVTRGEPMSGVFSGTKLVNPSVVEAIRNGERTGKLGTLLLHVADYLDEENEIVIKTLTSVIEPIILIIMGAFVGFVAVSMFLPLFDLVGMAQGGGH